MNTYRIQFSGVPIGRLSHAGERVTREVKAADAKAAALCAYETHEHIHMQVKVELLHTGRE